MEHYKIEAWSLNKAVGMLLYLSTRTWPNIAFAVSIVAKFTLDACKFTSGYYLFKVGGEPVRAAESKVVLLSQQPKQRTYH